MVENQFIVLAAEKKKWKQTIESQFIYKMYFNLLKVNLKMFGNQKVTMNIKVKCFLDVKMLSPISA